MRKKIFATMLVAVVAVAASYNVYQSQSTNTLSDLALANVEALASEEVEHAYEIRKEDSIEIWDDATGIYKKMVTIVCEGSGFLVC